MEEESDSVRKKEGDRERGRREGRVENDDEESHERSGSGVGWLQARSEQTMSGESCWRETRRLDRG